MTRFAPAHPRPAGSPAAIRSCSFPTSKNLYQNAHPFRRRADLYSSERSSTRAHPAMYLSPPTTRVHRIDHRPRRSARGLPYRLHPPQRVRNATCAEYVRRPAKRIKYRLATSIPNMKSMIGCPALIGNPGITSQFDGIGTGSFVVKTANPSRESALADVGLDAQTDKIWNVFADYTAPTVVRASRRRMAMWSRGLHAKGFSRGGFKMHPLARNGVEEG